jgi:membrane-bound metal-dependent hydrolase YbcI (DUF457 family)
MNGPQHVAVGAVSAGLILWGLKSAGMDVGTSAIVTGSVVAAVGALAPDIDYPQATIGMRIPVTLLAFGASLLLLPLLFSAMPVAWGAQKALGSPAWFYGMGALLLVPGAILLALSLAVTRAFSHRGVTHSFAFAAGSAVFASAACIAFGYAWWYGLFFAWGWLTHLAADSTTPKGLQSLFWPWAGREIVLSDTVNHGVPEPLTGATALGVAGILGGLILAGGLTGWGMKALVAGAQRPGATVASTTNTASVDIPLARKRLAEASPTIAAGLTDPDHPEVLSSNGLTSFTWQYLSKPTPSSVAVKRITITLDGAGHIVGVDGD